jgi:serine/threonine protein kinase
MPVIGGARLGPFEILSPLGRGGMGEVYKARDTRLDRVVAIKILPPQLAGDPHFRERLPQARAVSSLSHPHICGLFDIGGRRTNGGTATIRYLVIEYLEETLESRLGKGALDQATGLQVASEIAGALDAARGRHHPSRSDPAT